jgi:regulator of cell morphogenesis and NO signaling
MIALTNSTRRKSRENWRDLMTHILEAYHDPLRAALPRLERLIDQVARERRAPIHVLDWLLREFSFLADLLRSHLVQQEEQLFPMIRHVCRSIEKTRCDCPRGAALEQWMVEATRTDQEAVASVHRVESCLAAADWETNRPPVEKLVKAFHELRADLEEHVQLETNVLFPVVRDLIRGRDRRVQQLAAAGRRCQTELEAPTTSTAELIVADQETG